jgi:hypothetical protein
LSPLVQTVYKATIKKIKLFKMCIYYIQIQQMSIFYFIFVQDCIFEIQFCTGDKLMNFNHHDMLINKSIPYAFLGSKISRNHVSLGIDLASVTNLQ